MRIAWLAILLVSAGALGVLLFGIDPVGGGAGMDGPAAATPRVSAAPPSPSVPAPAREARARGEEPPPPVGTAPSPSPTTAPSPTPTPMPAERPPAAGQPAVDQPVAWRRSRAVGLPYAGSLRRGVELPSEGRDFFTWDPVEKNSPNRAWRRWGTDRLIRFLLDGLRRYRSANPDAPRVGIGDLSRPRGGDFGARFGNLGHASHQNGLDVDIYYPRRDRRERRPHQPRLVDRLLAQKLVDTFAAAGATHVFVGPRLDLTGPPGVVQPLVHHDDHLHVRIG